MTNPKDDSGDGGEAISLNSLIPVHRLSRPDRLYDLQLARDLAIANERTLRELGPPPPGGVPVEPKRKPRPWHPGEPDKHNITEEETMNLKHAAMMVAVSMATLMAPGTQADDIGSDREPPKENKPVAWPDNGLAERELGDGKSTFPRNMFVEHDGSKWHAWILTSNNNGPVSALDFFSGEVLENVRVGYRDAYDNEFVDSKGVTHGAVDSPDFQYMDFRSRGALGGIFLEDESIEPKDACGSIWLDISESDVESGDVRVGEKTRLYQSAVRSASCPSGKWESLDGAVLDLRDGTLLISGGKYIFRLRWKDMSPVGAAPHLRLVETGDVYKILKEIREKGVDNAGAFFVEQLHLP